MDTDADSESDATKTVSSQENNPPKSHGARLIDQVLKRPLTEISSSHLSEVMANGSVPQDFLYDRDNGTMIDRLKRPHPEPSPSSAQMGFYQTTPSQPVQQLGHPYVQSPNDYMTYQALPAPRSARFHGYVGASPPVSSHGSDYEQRLRQEMDRLQMSVLEANSRAEQAERAAWNLEQHLHEVKNSAEQAKRAAWGLEEQLREASSRAEQAERAAEELERQLRSRLSEETADSGNASDSINDLKTQNKELRAELDDARSHIFSLQPYGKDLTPKEVGQEFDELVNGITDWVAHVIDPILDNKAATDEILEAARRRPADLRRLKTHLDGNTDLLQASGFPETDVDVLTSLVLRLLDDRVFQKPLFGAMPDVVKALNLVEGSMQSNAEPRRDIFSLRTWRAETFNAVICSPVYQKDRKERASELASNFVGLFRIFTKDRKQLARNCLDRVIKPSILLHEKLLTATHHYYLTLKPYMTRNAHQGLEQSSELVDDLPNLACQNILQNRKHFSMDKLGPELTEGQLKRELVRIVAVVPALIMRPVGRGDMIKAPTVVRPQQMLVGWGCEEKWAQFIDKGEPTLIHRLYNLGGERKERKHEGGFMASCKSLLGRD